MKKRKTERIDPANVPIWLDNPEMPAPCPCGRPFEDEVIMYKGETGLVQLFHPECVNLIDDEDEYK